MSIFKSLYSYSTICCSEYEDAKFSIENSLCLKVSTNSDFIPDIVVFIDATSDTIRLYETCKYTPFSSCTFLQKFAVRNRHFSSLHLYFCCIAFLFLCSFPPNLEKRITALQIHYFSHVLLNISRLFYRYCKHTFTLHLIN